MPAMVTAKSALDVSTVSLITVAKQYMDAMTTEPDLFNTSQAHPSASNIGRLVTVAQEYNNNSGTGDDGGASWLWVFDMCQLAATVIGFILNLLTLLTLFCNAKGFSRIILYLLRHQSLVDAMVRYGKGLFNVDLHRHNKNTSRMAIYGQ